MTTSGDKLQSWLLHSRPFRETSLLLDFLTRERGRCSVIARGVRNPRSQKKAILQPFVPLQISLAGKSELQNLRDAEALGCVAPLTGNRLFAALYVNELLTRLMPAHEADSRIFDDYCSLLAQLSQGSELEPVLRSFELGLLDSLGYGLQFTRDAESGEDINSDAWYSLTLEAGFIRQETFSANELASSQQNAYLGRVLLDIERRDFSGATTRRMAKRLLRHVLQQHLGNRELASRSLFVAEQNDL